MLSRMGIDLWFTNHMMVHDNVVIQIKPRKIGPNKDLKDLSIVEINTMMAQKFEPESTRNLTKCTVDDVIQRIMHVYLDILHLPHIKQILRLDISVSYIIIGVVNLRGCFVGWGNCQIVNCAK